MVTMVEEPQLTGGKPNKYDDLLSFGLLRVILLRSDSWKGTGHAWHFQLSKKKLFKANGRLGTSPADPLKALGRCRMATGS